MNTITKNFLDDFVENKNYVKLSESEKFELFINYCVINKEYDSVSFDLKSTLTGKATQGIDGIGIIVNNKLCSTYKEIDDLIKINRILNVQFILIQSKTSPKFDGTQIGGFFTWVKSFFKDDFHNFKTEEMKNFIEMRKFIYDNSKYMKERNPICSLYYACDGKWVDDENLKKIIKGNKNELEDTNLFEKVNFYPCDTRKIQSMYRKTKEPIEATINFERRVTLPTIPKVEVAYSGMIPFKEFKNIIIDDTDKMKSVFDDNIRDYLEQKDNPVNKDINSTIADKRFEYFSILNNGVTVVADQITGAGDSFTITNYQVVNGCQTSHVLYENRNVDGIDRLNIPLKIIITDDADIKSQITRATNNQTAVGIEQLEALTEFQKNLELFYNSLPKDENKLYYERRTNQYKNKDVLDFRVISIEIQVKTFSAMFLDRPHFVAGYYGKLTKEMGNEIFDPSHKHMPYYTSSLAYFVLDNFFNNGFISDELWRFRHHMLMLFRILVDPGKLPFFNSTKIDEYCEKIICQLNNREEALRIFNMAVDIIKSKEAGLNLNDRKTCERKNTTTKLLKVCNNTSILNFR